jgi:hypothetical protein
VLVLVLELPAEEGLLLLVGPRHLGHLLAPGGGVELGQEREVGFLTQRSCKPGGAVVRISFARSAMALPGDPVVRRPLLYTARRRNAPNLPGGTMLDKLTKETFEPRKGEAFKLTDEAAGEVELKLASVQGTGLQGKAEREQFSLHFHGPRSPSCRSRSTTSRTPRWAPWTSSSSPSPVTTRG